MSNRIGIVTFMAVVQGLVCGSAAADGPLFPRAQYGAGHAPNSVAIADLDGDGDADLVVANAVSDDVSILLNHGDGTFAPDVTYGVGDEPFSVAIADLDGDGDADLAVANAVSDDVSILLNHGDGTFAADVTYGAGDSPSSVAIADLDGDGDADLAVANWNSDNVSILLNQSAAPGPLPDLTVLPGEFSLPAYAVEGHPYRIEATVRNVGSEPAADTFDVWFLQAPPSDPDDWTRIEELTVYGLDPGESVVLGTPFVPDEAGLWHLQVIVDVDDVIDESDEDNNEVVDIATAYPIIGILASCQHHVDTEMLDIDAVVHNHYSGEDVTAGLVTWDLYDSSGAPVPGHGGAEDPFTYNPAASQWENHGNPTDGGDLTIGETYTVRVRYMLSYPAYVEFLKASGIASLTCHVQDGFGDPLNNAQVELWHPLIEWLHHHDATYEGFTGPEGTVFFEQLPAGVHVARISHGDFFPRMKIFLLLSDQDHVKHITLGATAEEIFESLLDPLKDACEGALDSMANDIVSMNDRYLGIALSTEDDLFWTIADVTGSVMCGTVYAAGTRLEAGLRLGYSSYEMDDVIGVLALAASRTLDQELKEESVTLAMDVVKTILVQETVSLTDITDPNSPTGEFYTLLRSHIDQTDADFRANAPAGGPDPDYFDLERADGVVRWTAERLSDLPDQGTLVIPYDCAEPVSFLFPSSKDAFDTACVAHDVASVGHQVVIVAQLFVGAAAIIAAPFSGGLSLLALAPVAHGLGVMDTVTTVTECVTEWAVCTTYGDGVGNWFNDMRSVPTMFKQSAAFFIEESTDPVYLAQGAERDVWISQFIFTPDWEFFGAQIIFAPWDGGVANNPAAIVVFNPGSNDGPVNAFAHINRDWRSVQDLPLGESWHVDNDSHQWSVEPYDFWCTFVPRYFRVDVYGGVPVTVSQWREVEYYVLPELFGKRAPTLDTLVPFSTGRGQLRLRDIEELLPTEYLVFEGDLGEEYPVLESEFTIGSDVSSVEFHLLYPPGSVIEFSVEDETGRRIGHNFATSLADRQFPGTFSGRMKNPQIIRIPNAAEQTYTVRAELAKQFWLEQQHHVVAKAFEVPNRPAVLTVQPNQIEAVGTPGSEVEVFVLVGEAGLAEALLDVTAEIGPIELGGVVLTNVTPGLVEMGPVLPESGTQASFVLGVPADALVGDYTGEITVSSANAGSLTVPVVVDVSHSPSQPTVPVGPTLGFVDESYEYTTAVSDPEGEDVYYRFYWGDGPGTEWLGPYASGEACSASHTWAEAGVYRVKAIAKDAGGHYSEWSDPLLVCIGTEDADGDGIPDECEPRPVMPSNLERAGPISPEEAEPAP